MLDAGVLGVGLDALVVGLGADALDLEPGHEDREVAARARDEGDRALGREEAEIREVADVLLVEEDDARQAVLCRTPEQALAAPLEFVGRERQIRSWSNSPPVERSASEPAYVFEMNESVFWPA